MKNYFLMQFVFYIILIFPNQVKSQTVFACTNLREIYELDLVNCTGKWLCNNNDQFGDIAYENGILYGVSFNTTSTPYYGTIYKINTVTGDETMISRIENKAFDGLIGDGNGNLYAASDNSIFKYNIATDVFSEIGITGSYICVGDLAFKGGELYMIGLTNDGLIRLIKIFLSPFSYSEIGVLNFGNNFSYGLATLSISGSEIMYISTTDCENQNDIYQVDETNATTTLICSNNIEINAGHIWGLASKEKTEGISEISEINNFTIYPNPVKSCITIQIQSGKMERYILTLRNIQGSEVLVKSIEFANTFNLDIDKIDNGIYFLTLQNEKKNMLQKVVVQK